MAAVEEHLDFFGGQAIVGVPGYYTARTKENLGETNDA
jgi:hypothetical protein